MDLSQFTITQGTRYRVLKIENYFFFNCNRLLMSAKAIFKCCANLEDELIGELLLELI